MQYAIKHRSTGAAIITVEIECTEATSEAIKLGLAAKAANLGGAYLRGANLGGTLVSDIGQRSDGHQFFMQSRDDGPWISVGCRYFSLADARKHWTETRGGTPLGDETNLMLDHAERIARHRGWIPVAQMEPV